MINVYAVFNTQTAAVIRAKKIAARFQSASVQIARLDQGWVVWSTAYAIGNLKPLWQTGEDTLRVDDIQAVA